MIKHMKKKIYYLGPPGTYSEIAAKSIAAKLKEDIEIVPEPSAQAVARSLSLSSKQSNDNHTFAVIPYYNYLDGLIQECLDLIYEHRLYIIGCQRVPVVLSLGSNQNNNDADKIFSHAKALAQCSDYLWENYPGLKQIPVASTAEGVKMVLKSKKNFAIAPKETIEGYGLEVLSEDIANKRHGRTNFTDFYLLACNDVDILPTPRSKLTMVAVTPQVDRPGLLAEILRQVAFYGLNNAKIHSRPAIDNVALDLDPQMFYLEIMAPKDDPNLQRCIDSLDYWLTPDNANCEVLRVLGSYNRPTLNQ